MMRFLQSQRDMNRQEIWLNFSTTYLLWLRKFQNYTSNSKLELSWSKRIRVHWIRKFLTIKRLIVFQVMLLKISLVFQKKITVNVFMVGPWKCPRLPNWVWLAHHLQTKLEIYIKFKLWVMAFSNDQLK